MTSMPDAVAAPSRPPQSPAQSQRGGSAGDDAHDGGFSRLVDEAAEDESDEAATRPDRLRRHKQATPDSPAAAQSAITQAVVQPAVQPGGSTDAPLMPWMVAAPAAAPAPEEGEAAPPTGQQAPSPEGNGDKTAGLASAAVPPQPEAGVSTPADKAQAGSPALQNAAQDAPQDGTGRTATDPAFPQPAPIPTEATAPGTAMAVPVAADTTQDARASRRDESTDPRTAVRATRGTARPAGGGKAEPFAAPPTAAPTNQPIADAVAAAPAAPEPAPLFTTPPGAGGGTAATGFEALPTLPAQAATQYAAAAASGRAATAHSPAMAQLAAPLVRVLESGGGEFHIDLAPAELGRIRVVADVSDGKVSLAIQAEQADTLALLRRDLQQLERALGDAGLSLDNASLQFSLQEDGQSRGFAAPDQGRAAAGWRAEDRPEASPEPVADRPMRPIDGLVDVTV